MREWELYVDARGAWWMHLTLPHCIIPLGRYPAVWTWAQCYGSIPGDLHHSRS